MSRADWRRSKKRMREAARGRSTQLIKQDPPPPDPPPGFREAWVSRGFLVQVYEVRGFPDMELLAICRSDQSPKSISWDVLQKLKRECGRGAAWAMEVYPPDHEMVNDADMRHLWVGPRPPWAWHGTGVVGDRNKSVRSWRDV